MIKLFLATFIETKAKSDFIWMVIIIIIIIIK